MNEILEKLKAKEIRVEGYKKAISDLIREKYKIELPVPENEEISYAASKTLVPIVNMLFNALAEAVDSDK